MAAREIGERQLLAITALVFAVVLVVVGTFIFLGYRQYSGLVVKREALRKEIQGHDEVIARGPKAVKDLEDSKAMFQECKEYLPADENVQQMLKSISDMCLESALDSVDIKWDSSARPAALGAAKQPYEAIRYKCEFRGSYHQLARFVSKIEDWKHFKRFASIQTFSLEAADRGLLRDSGKQRHKALLTLEVYRYNEPVKPPAGS
jgi:Tfp pilus assembly protein PilO